MPRRAVVRSAWTAARRLHIRAPERHHVGAIKCDVLLGRACRRAPQQHQRRAQCDGRRAHRRTACRQDRARDACSCQVRAHERVRVTSLHPIPLQVVLQLNARIAPQVCFLADAAWTSARGSACCARPRLRRYSPVGCLRDPKVCCSQRASSLVVSEMCLSPLLSAVLCAHLTGAFQLPEGLH